MIIEKQYSLYLNALLQGNSRQCSEIVAELLAENVAMPLLYTNLFQRSLYQVGELWECNRISVAVEHLATAITERMLAIVYPQLLAGVEPNSRRAIITCSVNEYHQIGARMVADIMETRGWDVSFLGANTPSEDLLSMISAQSPEFLGLSLSIPANLDPLYRLIEIVRAEYPLLDIFVGGQAFRWEGTDIGKKFTNVEYVSSLQNLGSIITVR